jgi:virulence factor Mce-like protein
MKPRDRSGELRRQRRFGIAVLALGALLLFVAFTGTLPLFSGGGGRTVTARFAQANQVDDSTPVRVGGVDVGTVSSLRPAPGRSTDVVISITADGVRLHSDASAQIRWRTLLGGSMYIDVVPGSPSAPPLQGEIPLSRTGSQVDWDQFNNQLPTQTRPRFRQMLSGLDLGLSSPAKIANTLQALGPAAAVVGQAAQALRGADPGDLPNLIRGSAATLKSLSASTTALENFISGTDATLAVTAQHNAALAQAIQLSPPALAATDTTSTRLDVTLTNLDPLIAQLQPGARLLGPATAVLEPMLVQTGRLLDGARPLLRVAPGALTGLGAMSEEGTPLIAGLTPTVNRLNADLVPLLNAKSSDTRLRLYETFGPMASALSDSLAGFDVNGGLYNFNVQVAAGSLLLPCDQGPGSAQLAQCLVSTIPGHRLGGRR